MHESLADRLAISVSTFLMRLAENLVGFGALENVVRPLLCLVEKPLKNYL